MKKRTSILVGTRYFFFTLLISFLLSSCGGSLQKDECLKSVKQMFPNGDVYSQHEGSYLRFVVIDHDSNIYNVETTSITSPKVTRVERLKKW